MVAFWAGLAPGLLLSFVSARVNNDRFLNHMHDQATLTPSSRPYKPRVAAYNDGTNDEGELYSSPEHQEYTVEIAPTRTSKRRLEQAREDFLDSLPFEVEGVQSGLLAPPNSVKSSSWEASPTIGPSYDEILDRMRDQGLQQQGTEAVSQSSSSSLILPRIALDPELLKTRRVIPQAGMHLYEKHGYGADDTSTAAGSSSEPGSPWSSNSGSVMPLAAPEVMNRLVEQVLEGQSDVEGEAALKKLQGQNNYRNPQMLDQKVIFSLEKTPQMDPMEVFKQPWQERYRAIRKLGAGAFGETWLVQNLRDNSLAVMKRVPYQDRYLTWNDQFEYLGQSNNNLQVAIDSLRDECAWAYYIQRFGLDFRYVSRFMFMSCLETNLAPKNRKAPFPEQRPGDHHELYVMLSFAGEPLDKVADKITLPGQAVNILSELTTSLHYMNLAGIVHHDLKADNIMYRETEVVDGIGQRRSMATLPNQALPSGSLVPISSAPTSGHIVVIDFGAMVDASCSASAFMDAAYTPGFIPIEYEASRRAPTPRTSLDVFSMAGVFSQVLLGENLVHRYIRSKKVGARKVYVTDWGRWSKFINNPEIFVQAVYKVANEAFVIDPANPSVGKTLNRVAVLNGVVHRYPRFLQYWRRMWGDSGSDRAEAAEQMWQMFLHE